jgi:hypothetical protein
VLFVIVVVVASSSPVDPEDEDEDEDAFALAFNRSPVLGSIISLGNSKNSIFSSLEDDDDDATFGSKKPSKKTACNRCIDVDCFTAN